MRKLAYCGLVLVVIAIGLLHFFTPGYLVLYHDTFRRLSYFPIVLGAIWFGLWGGLSIAVLSSIAFIPHLLLYIGQGPQLYIGELMEVVLYLAAGTVTGVIAGREARLQEQYRKVAQKLEKSYDRLHEEAELLLEAEAQLSKSQRLSALGQLSASLAHEIKTPLSSIKGTAEIFLDEFPADHPKREFVLILLKEVDRLNATVEEVLQYSRGQHQDTQATEPVAQILDRVGKLLETHLRKKAIQLEVSGRQSAGDFPVAGAKMTQVFLNIIINAIDALPSNGKITVDSRKIAGGLRISICDNGPGIALAKTEQVFEPFITGKEDGTGLGLSISRKIVESYGGTISCFNLAAGGACFEVFLPEANYPEEAI